MYWFKKSYVIILFLLMGAFSEYFLWRSEATSFLLAVMSPILSIATWFEFLIPFLGTLSSFQNEFFLVLPVTLLYFAFTGYWLWSILHEEGFTRFLTLSAFITFLVIVHWQAFLHIESILAAPILG